MTDNVINLYVRAEEAHDYGIKDLVYKAYKHGRKTSRFCQTESNKVIDDDTEIEITLHRNGDINIRIWEKDRKHLDGEE